MNYEKKVEYINSLAKSQYGEFLKLFLPGSFCELPPNDEMKFYKNGKILYSDSGKKYFVYWKIKENKLHIWRNKKKKHFPEDSYEIWNLEKIDVSYINNKTKGIKFYFKIIEKTTKKEKEDLFRYVLHGSPYNFRKYEKKHNISPE